MVTLLISILVFAASLYVLIEASNYFTDAAERIGLAFGIPDFVVGITIVAVGTSLPELVSSVFAVLQGSSEIVIGNVVGSNVTNIFLIIGLTVIAAKKIRITYELVHIDLPLLMGSALLLVVTVWDGVFTLFEAFICLAAFLVYLFHSISGEKETGGKKIAARGKKVKPREPVRARYFVILILSALFIFVGGRYTIMAVVNISGLLAIGKEVIAATVVALGTSLPELVVSLTAARQGRPEIAVGNVIGSNIFNAVAVMGIPALIGELVIPGSILMFGVPMMVIASILFFFMTQDKEITRWEGWLLLVFYALYIGGLFR
ncbi:calcium/sodium antiporter [candidate division WOR-3 bacterium]|nr:calcium/sodium antiporter [candidate division WOR-3 bacterium]